MNVMTACAHPTVSIGLPVWNSVSHIDVALRSLREQDFDDLEVVVCDNASNDGTSDIVRSHADQDSRIRYFRNRENIGATRNFGRTFELARGKYFRWAGADDFVSPGALSRCISALEEDPSAVLAFPETILVDVEGGFSNFYDDGEGWNAHLASRRFRRSLGSWGLVNVLYGVVRTDVLRQTALFADYPGSDFVLQADLAIRGRFVRVNGEFLYRRIHAGATSQLDDQELREFYEPERVETFESRFSRIFRDHFRLISAADVGTLERVRMFGHLTGHAKRWRKELLGEGLSAVRSLVSGRTATSAQPPR